MTFILLISSSFTYDDIGFIKAFKKCQHTRKFQILESFLKD